MHVGCVSGRLIRPEEGILELKLQRASDSAADFRDDEQSRGNVASHALRIQFIGIPRSHSHSAAAVSKLETSSASLTCAGRIWMCMGSREYTMGATASSQH